MKVQCYAFIRELVDFLSSNNTDMLQVSINIPLIVFFLRLLPALPPQVEGNDVMNFKVYVYILIVGILRTEHSSIGKIKATCGKPLISTLYTWHLKSCSPISYLSSNVNLDFWSVADLEI